MNKLYKIALIGCGVMGESHVSQLHDRDNIEVKYVCDRALERAQRLQKKYYITQICDDYTQILLDAEVDIVIIATPPSTHLQILKDCLQHKKHVLCEKPITNTMEQAEQFVQAVQAHPECKVLVGNILRHNVTYQKIADMIQLGALGHPLVFRMTQNHHTMDWPQYLSNIIDCAPLVNCGIHYVDVMEWFSGEHAVEVKAMGSRTQSDVPKDSYNYGIMTIRFSNGSIGYYEAGWANTCSADNTKEIVGPAGRIRLTYQKDRVSNAEEGDLIEYYKYPEKTYTTINSLCNRKPTDTQLSYLIKMIETNCEAIPTMEHILSCMDTCFQADVQARECAAGAYPTI
ncbi:MAG: Gfo/Idh/MocA family oxidoreductase [Lachnospiraceae bacterium]